VHAAELVEVGQLTDQRNTANHVAARTLADPAAVRADQRIVNWLADLPVLAEAFRSGRITAEHVEKLRLADNPRVHQRLINEQEFWVRIFTTSHFRDLDHAIEEWLPGADPDGAEPNNKEQEFGPSITPLQGGKVKVSGTFARPRVNIVMSQKSTKTPLPGSQTQQPTSSPNSTAQISTRNVSSSTEPQSTRSTHLPQR
jgi:hypothetical protein